MIIADELLLLLLDDDTGKLRADGSTKVDPVLAGAVMVDLALGGFLGIAQQGESIKSGRVAVRKAGPTGDPLLDSALVVANEFQGDKPAALIGKLSKGLRAQVLDRLVLLGAVTVEKGKVLGLFPTSRWPEADARFEAQVRDRLVQVLLAGKTADTRTSALISMLLTADVLAKVMSVDRNGAPVDKKLLKARAKEVADGDWASAAALKVVKDFEAAMAIAVMVPIMTATTITVTS